MATSKLELAVGTGQWDAGLKKAQQALNSFTQAQGGLQQALAKDNGDMQKFIQMMGKIDSTANTTKGQMNDYKRVLEQLTTQYNQMSDAQKKSIGQDYLQTIDQLKQKFSQAKQQVEDFNKSLGEAGKVKMPESSGGGLFSGGKLEGMLQVFGGNLMTKAAGMATGLAMEIGDAVKQGIELAKQGEGIRIAFERLGRGDILDGLREATHGTVTDLELMKAAVKFNDFKLPVEELGTMLAFAQQKAKDTGQSVDYMVDSIVTGLGRKSLMILDNLGLSAAEIKEKMKETGDMTKAVGEIIREQMQKAGDYVETAADRAAQANVSLQNKMEELGRKFAPLEEASNNFWTSMKIGILDVVGGPLTNLLNKLTEAGRLMNAYGQMGGSGKVGRMTANLASASEGNRQSVYQQQQAQFWKYINPREQQIKDIRAWQSGNRNEALQKRIGDITEKYGSLDVTKIQAEVDAAKKMLSEYQQSAKQILSPVKADIDTNGAEQNVESLKVKLIELEAQRKKAIAAGDTDLSKNLTKQINQTKADIKGLNPTALKTTHKKTEKVYAEGSIAWQEQEVQRLTKAWKEAGAAVRDDYAKQLGEAKQRLAEMTGGFDPGKMKDISGQSVNLTMDTEKLNDLQAQRKKAIASGDTELSKNLLEQINQVKSDPNGLTVPVKLKIQSPVEQWQAEIKRLQELIGQTWDSAAIDVYNQKIEKLNEKINDFSHTSVKGGESSSKAWSSTASAISSVGSAINAIDDPTAKIIGLVAQGIASVVSATGIATEKAAGQSRHWAEYLAAAASITAQMIATISQIHSASGYANGGIVKGNSYSGDNIPADTFVNAGELILNKSQQGAIASQLQNPGGNLRVTGVLRGEDLLISIDKSARRQGRGELVFWKDK